jgi:hypothetical protein
MTERSFAGLENRMWWGVVDSVMDPDQEGRVRVRIHKLHDNESDVPSSALPWSKPLQDITSAGHNKIGKAPVGLIVGSTVMGFFLDNDQQYPVHIGSIAKAGDASNTETVGGKEQLKDGTNSTPPGIRIANNANITRASRNIQTDDQTQISYNNNYTPPEQNDTDGVNITKNAIDKTKFSSIPTVSSVLNPVGNILSQLQKIDPQNLNAVLPNAIPNFQKILDLNTFSSTSGAVGVLGQALGSAFNSIASQLGSFSSIISSITPLLNSFSSLSTNASQALTTALSLLNQEINVSATVQGVINSSLQPLINTLTPLIQNGSITVTQFENIISLFLSQIQDNGTQATLGQGATQSNIFNMLSTLLPTITSQIENTLNNHLPPSVLNQPLITEALKKFSMNQSLLKAPTNGKKALATQAVSQSTNQIFTQLTNNLSQIENIGSAALQPFKDLAGL